MSVPKSVTRINKDGVKFVSHVDKVQYTIEELSRAGFRDVAKLLRRKLKSKDKSTGTPAPYQFGTLHSNIGTWVRRGGEGKPFLQVGVYDKERARKKNIEHAFYAIWQELGTENMDAANQNRGFLRATVMDSVDDIRIIQGQYLSAINDENEALGLIDEEEELEDD